MRNSAGRWTYRLMKRQRIWVLRAAKDFRSHFFCDTGDGYVVDVSNVEWGGIFRFRARHRHIRFFQRLITQRYILRNHINQRKECVGVCVVNVWVVCVYFIWSRIYFDLFLSWARNSMREFVRPWVPRSVPGLGPRWSNRKRPCPPVRDDIVKKY